MKNKLKLLALSLLVSFTSLQAQTSQSVSLTTPGTLSEKLGSQTKLITDLTITGTMNSADFATIKQMSLLKNLDLSAVSNEELANGTFSGQTLLKLILPISIKTIGENVFQGAKINTLDFSVCKNLEEIGGGAFINFQTDNNTLDFSTNTKLNRFPANTIFSIGTFSKYNGHVILPKALESLSYCLFAEFQGSVEFPAGIKSIGHRAFYNAKPSKPLIFTKI